MRCRAGQLEPLTLAAGQALLAGKTPFRTTRGLDVLPVEAAVYYKRRLAGDERAAAEAIWRDLYASFEEPPGDPASLDYYETQTLETPKAGVVVESLDVGAETVDGLWVALFARRGDDPEAARQALAGRTLSLGIVPALDLAGLTLEPDRALRRSGRLALVFEMPNVAAPAGTGAAYRRLPAAAEDDPLTYPTVVELTLGDAASLRLWDDLEPLEAGTGDYPPALDDEARAERLITWVRLRLPQDPGAAGGQPAFRVSWVGINATPVTQRAPVAAELLPAGTGEPDQTATLANTPVLPDSLRLLVNGERWTRIDDLNAAPPETAGPAPRLTEGPEPVGAPSAAAPSAAAQVYALDPEAGTIRFGTGLAGARPPRGAVILASYDFGGGPAGMVGIGAIAKGPSGLRVSNPVPTWGGAAGETTAEAERRIPGFLANRDRLVSAEDVRIIAAATPGIAIGRLEVLPLLHPDQPGSAAPGVVTVMVIPASDPRNPARAHAGPAVPDRRLRAPRAAPPRDHRAPRARAELRRRLGLGRGRRGDRPRPAPVREAVKAALETFLSPLPAASPAPAGRSAARSTPPSSS